MKKSVTYRGGRIAVYGLEPSSEMVLAKSAKVGEIKLPGGNAIKIYIQPTAEPLLLVESIKDAYTQIELPLYDDLDSLCQEQTYCLYKQAYLMTDVFLRDGICSLSDLPAFQQRLAENLSAKNYTVFIENK